MQPQRWLSLCGQLLACIPDARAYFEPAAFVSDQKQKVHRHNVAHHHNNKEKCRVVNVTGYQHRFKCARHNDLLYNHLRGRGAGEGLQQWMISASQSQASTILVCNSVCKYLANHKRAHGKGGEYGEEAVARRRVKGADTCHVAHAKEPVQQEQKLHEENT